MGVTFQNTGTSGSGTDSTSLVNLLLVLLVLVAVTLFKKPKAPSFQIGSWMKFGRIVLRVNTHRLT